MLCLLVWYFSLVSVLSGLEEGMLKGKCVIYDSYIYTIMHIGFIFLGFIVIVIINVIIYVYVYVFMCLVSFLNLLNLVASNVCFAMFYLFPLIINQSINYLCMCFSNNVLDSYFVHLLASLITRFVFLFLFCFWYYLGTVFVLH